MPCLPFTRPDGSRGIMCTRGAGKPPPCPFPAVTAEAIAAEEEARRIAPWVKGGPFQSKRHGAGTVLGLAPGGRLGVVFPGGKVHTYDLDALRAARAAELAPIFS